MTKPLSLHTLDTAITFSHVSARIMIGTQDLSKSSVFLVSCFYTNVSDSEVLYIQYVFVKYIITIKTVFHSCLNITKETNQGACLCVLMLYVPPHMSPFRHFVNLNLLVRGAGAGAGVHAGLKCGRKCAGYVYGMCQLCEQKTSAIL